MENISRELESKKIKQSSILHLNNKITRITKCKIYVGQDCIGTMEDSNTCAKCEKSTSD